MQGQSPVVTPFVGGVASRGSGPRDRVLKDGDHTPENMIISILDAEDLIIACFSCLWARGAVLHDFCLSDI